MEQQKIAIITDSTCDVPQAMVDDYSIVVIPQIIIWDDREFLDRVTIQPEEFYLKLASEANYPSTSAATIESFVKAYRQVELAGMDEILVLTVSGEMSRTYQNAVMASRQTGLNVKVIDARGPSMSLGWQVLEAARLREKGANLDEMAAGTEVLRKRLALYVGMESLEYLQKGGRIGGAAKWLGTMLHIQPVISINHESGLVEPVGLARTQQKMIDMLFQKFKEKMEVGKLLHVAVLHGNCPEQGKQLADRVQEILSPVELHLSITGPVLGINTGPNALGLCGYWE